MALSRSISERYIRALVIDPQGPSIEDVISRLERESIVTFGPAYVEGLRADANLPENFRPRDRRHGPSMIAAERKGIDSPIRA